MSKKENLGWMIPYGLNDSSLDRFLDGILESILEEGIVPDIIEQGGVHVKSLIDRALYLDSVNGEIHRYDNVITKLLPLLAEEHKEEYISNDKI